jgi:hypothetical protein
MDHWWNDTGGQNLSTRRKIYPTATLITTNPTQTGLESKAHFEVKGRRLVTRSTALPVYKQEWDKADFRNVMKRCEDTKTLNMTCHSLRNVRKHFTFGCTCPIGDPRHTRHFYQLQSGPCLYSSSNVHQILYESSEIKSRDFRFGEDKDNAVRLSHSVHLPGNTRTSLRQTSAFGKVGAHGFPDVLNL